jgi:hypothetical protein
MRDRRLGLSMTDPSIRVMTSPGLIPAAAARIFLEDFVHEHAFLLRHPELFGEFRGQRLNADTEPAPNDPTLLHQLLQNLLRHVRRNRKADALCEIDDGRIDADHFPREIEERPAGISGIDRRIGLNEIFIAGQIDIFASNTADHTSVTVRSKPKGLPTASTHWPTRTVVESPNVAFGSG